MIEQPHKSLSRETSWDENQINVHYEKNAMECASIAKLRPTFWRRKLILVHLT
jgi:hypothetical protein